MNKLILSGTNLTVPIPKEIGILTDLIVLHLSHNALTGEIPTRICQLYKLEQLFLNSNGLEGSIPLEIGNLTSLKWLILYDNLLSGIIPNRIGNLNRIEVIRDGGNNNLEGRMSLLVRFQAHWETLRTFKIFFYGRTAWSVLFSWSSKTATSFSSSISR
ncbi:hypothetical protein FEM48_Zijuj10G0082700 [Ziziphus jujuba var. spinosa]|uniref:Uncharacterized protein n=1 Tax=Ziziphus jujuba var. spinosa TaxID=714518 RepID=A0A978UM98_ZIZJJ|nr:hypothetical protein FEM48_Zijuj10G0082700 [Ziziphus jujuba var. spinosa]